MEILLLLCYLIYIFDLANATSNRTSEAYAFTVYDQSSAVRALVTAQSLKDVGHSKETVVVVNDHAVSPFVMEKLNAAFDAVEPVTLPDWFTRSTWTLEASLRPEVMAALPKMYLWHLTQYKRLVYLDSCTLVLKSLDELFLQPGFAAVPEVDSEEDFDTAVMVLTPSQNVFDQLLNTSIASAFSWSDENILNSVLRSWTALSPIYNTPDLPSNMKQDRYALTEFTKVIQFLDEPQPWFDVYEETADVLHGSENDVDFRLRWWRTFMKTKGSSPERQNKYNDKANKVDEENQEILHSELARFHGVTGAASEIHKRQRRQSGCCATCRKGSCCCHGSCKCKCRWGGKARCRQRVAWWYG